ncbi:hypothetical protein T484DRAFT_1773548 [Baffinella frigidus]|nr:hypothetical protein T484DRAFT_1773548 [Cryptophyta sp. CCMP2293]
MIGYAARYGQARTTTFENGWTTARHNTHATTDIPVGRLPRAGVLWKESVAPRVQEAIARGFGFEASDVQPVDVFLVKYSADEAGGQKELSVHRDGALMTFSLLLNRPDDFERELSVHRDGALMTFSLLLN